MTHRIDIEFTRSEGAVLRLIGLVERKGFEVTGIEMPANDTGGESATGRLSLQIAPRDPARRIEVLSRHVEKVYGVTAVRRREAEPARLERAS